MPKFKNDIANLYIKAADDKVLSIESKPTLTDKQTIGITAAIGNYQFSINHNSLPQNVTATLVDKYMQTETPLNANTTYNFTITEDAASQGEQRFEVVFNNSNTASIIGETLVNNTNSNKVFKAIIASTISNNKAINIYVENAVNNKAQVMVRDIQGRIISSSYITNGNNSIQAPTSKGLYVVEINDGQNKQIEKIIR